MCVAAVVLIAAGLFGHVGTARAQDAPPFYLITYLEVAPKSVADARRLILAHAVDAKKAAGAVQVDALQRIDYPNHFALVEQWKSQAERQAYASSDSVTKFRAALAPLQSAGYDERPHGPLAVGPAKPASADSIMMVTHVDVIPTTVDAGTSKVKTLAEQGRGAAGNRRFDALVQASRKNHMTVVESWDSLASKNAWISTPGVRTFRDDLQPMSGSLYDERAYKLLR